MPSLLVTAFGQLGPSSYNPTRAALPGIESARADADDVTTAVLPVEFAAAREQLDELIARHSLDFVVCLGLAESRRVISMEKVAVNVMAARIPDNAGAQPVDEPVCAGGPTAYFSTLPVAGMAAAVRRAGVPAEVSYSAGTYVCNTAVFTALHATAGTPARAGFIHVPQALGAESPATGALTREGLTQDDITAGIVAALRALVTGADEEDSTPPTAGHVD